MATVTAPFRTPAGAQNVASAQGTGYDLLLGRRTYDLWASFWPTIKDGPFAQGLNTATKFVATHRPGKSTVGSGRTTGHRCGGKAFGNSNLKMHPI